jgi:hypothetical protein
MHDVLLSGRVWIDEALASLPAQLKNEPAQNLEIRIVTLPWARGR